MITDKPIPKLTTDQSSLFTKESLKAKIAENFDAGKAEVAMKANEGKQVYAVDMGGDKITVSKYTIQDGQLTHSENDRQSLKSTQAVGYLEFLKNVANEIKQNNAPIGISYAGEITGSVPFPTGSPNMRVLIDELTEKYGGDFKNLFPTLHATTNDAVAGAITGAVEAKRQLSNCDKVIYIINGSGLGGALYFDKTVIAMEPGHIQVVDALNVFGQTTVCGNAGNTYVCIERCAASKAGIEAIWKQQTGESLDGKTIGRLYDDGNQFAERLYDTSAVLVAHVIKGIAKAFNLLDGHDETAVVCHGGTFSVAGYGERVKQILDKDLGPDLKLLLTKDFSDNACADGAAIAALVKD